jgi:hypothetical protein
MNRLLIALVACASLLVGCAKSSTSTVVNEDGSWKRTVKLTVSKMTEGDESPWPDTFSLPKEGYTSASKVDKQERITTLVHNAKLGEGPLTDIIVREKGETIFKNYVTVRRLDENRVEYYEKVVFTKAKGAGNEGDKMIEELKAVIPASVNATDAECKQVSNDTMVGVMRMFLGPEDIMIGIFFTNPDGAERRLKAKMFKLIDKNLAKTFGDRMTAEQRTDAIKQMVTKLDGKKVLEDQKSSKGEAAASGDSGLIGMSTSVKLPGKILETNGEIDPFTGEVYWDFISNTAEFEPLEMRAICELKQ